MGYRVRNQDGELRFETFSQLRDAYVHQMVGPDDEVSEDGSGQWQKAGTMPRLVEALKAQPTTWQREGRWYVLAAVLLAAGAYFVVTGWGMVSFAIIAVIVVSFVTWTTFSGVKKRRR